MEEIEIILSMLHAVGAGLLVFLIKYAWDQHRVKHVFIVEDNPFDESLLRAALKLDRAKIHYCHNYTSFLVKRLLKKPDAVIVDYKLPDCEGDKIFKLCRGLAIPSIIITAEAKPIIGVRECDIVRKQSNYAEKLKLFLNRNSIA